MKLFLPKYPAILRYLYPRRFSKVVNSKALYLTFDDGPVPAVTPWVLDLLAEYDAKATFFCIGENVQKHPEIFRRILKEGHQVGNHTYNHLNGWRTSVSEYLSNTKKTSEIFQEVNPDFTDELFRPPYGKIRNSQAKALEQNGYKIVMWDILSGDYDQNFSISQCYDHVIKHAQPGSSIVFHDSQKASKNLKGILPEILDYYKEKDMEFRSLKDVL